MPEQKGHYYVSTLKGIIIILIAAGISLVIFGTLYFYWIETPMTKVPEIFDLSRVAKVNFNANLKPYLGKTKADFCEKDSDCPADHVCYTSRECTVTTQGTVCGPEAGDLLCHKKCLDDSDCPSDMPKCEATSFLIENHSVLIKICKST